MQSFGVEWIFPPGGALRARHARADLWSGLALLTRGLGMATLPALLAQFQLGNSRPTQRLGPTLSISLRV